MPALHRQPPPNRSCDPYQHAHTDTECEALRAFYEGEARRKADLSMISEIARQNEYYSDAQKVAREHFTDEGGTMPPYAWKALRRAHGNAWRKHKGTVPAPTKP